MKKSEIILIILLIVSLIGNIYSLYVCSEKNILELQGKANMADRVPILEDRIEQLESEIQELEDELKLFLIEVSGEATTTGAGTHAVAIVFKDGEIKHIAPVTNGEYSIMLKNNLEYSVYIQWSFIGQQTITSCKADDYELYSDIEKVTKNFEC